MDPIAYVVFAYPEEWPGCAGAFARHSLLFEQVGGGRPCALVPFLHAAVLLPRLAPCAVVLSGFGRSFDDFRPVDLKPVADFVTSNPDTPVLGLCGGHQLLAFIYEGRVDGVQPLRDQPMRRRRPGEPVERPDYHPDYFMETGFRELSVVERSPLFDGCPERPMVWESHYCEVKRLPEGFRLLASTADCRIQAMRHEYRPAVGLQFHPEECTERFPDGRSILEAFFRDVAGLVPLGAGDPAITEVQT